MSDNHNNNYYTGAGKAKGGRSGNAGQPPTLDHAGGQSLEQVEVEVGGSFESSLVLAQVHAQDNIHTELVPHVPYLRTHAHGQMPGQSLYCTSG